MGKIIIAAILFILVLCAVTMLGLRALFNKPEANFPQDTTLIGTYVNNYIFSEDKNSIYYFEIKENVLKIFEYNPIEDVSRDVIELNNVYSVSANIFLNNEEIIFMGRTSQSDFEDYSLFKVSTAGEVKQYEIYATNLIGVRSLDLAKGQNPDQFSDEELTQICNEYDSQESQEFNFQKQDHIVAPQSSSDPIFNVVLNEQVGKFIPKLLCADTQFNLVENRTEPIFLEKRSDGKEIAYRTSEWGATLFFTELDGGLRTFDSSKDYSLRVSYKGKDYDFGYSQSMDILSAERDMIDNNGNIYILRNGGEQPGELYLIKNK